MIEKDPRWMTDAELIEKLKRDGPVGAQDSIGLCPCCGRPTWRGYGETCAVCFWIQDYDDDEHEWSDQNGCTLFQWRCNYELGHRRAGPEQHADWYSRYQREQRFVRRRSFRERHRAAAEALWRIAELRLSERCGKDIPAPVYKQFCADRAAWEPEQIEICAFYGRLSAFAAVNGWTSRLTEGSFACLAAWLFGARPTLPDGLDGKACWPYDGLCTVSKELFSLLPELLREAFDEFYYPVRVQNDAREQAWVLLPKDQPLPYGAGPYRDFTPENDFEGRHLFFCVEEPE